MTNLQEAMKVVPKYLQTYCGCGEGWDDERCQKLTALENDGEHHCIFDNIKIGQPERTG